MIFIEIIDYDSFFYPKLLKSINDPPKFLYAEGNLDLLNSNSISIIGSRACSVSGIQIANQFAKDLCNYGLTIISGLAVGIDTAAHLGCLDVGGNTIAVLGSGFNNIYPKENIKLYHRIIENNGLIISEYSPNTLKKSEQFLARNRIVSGLSIGVLVIEAAFRSGTSVTAALAKSQHKEIFCIPHSINDKHGVGTNRLIKNGAHLVTCAEDIVNEFDFLSNSDISNSQENLFEQMEIQKVSQYSDVYNILVGPPTTVDEICEKLGKPVPYVNTALFTLELQGLIEKNRYGYQIKI